MNFMKFRNAKYKVLYLDQGNHKHKYRLGSKRIESSPDEKDLVVLVDKKLNLSQQSQSYAGLHQKQSGRGS